MTKKNCDEKQGIDTSISTVTDLIFTQMNAKAGIKRLGEKSIAAMFKYYKQLNEGPMPGKHFFGPIDPSDFTPGDRKMDLEAVNLIKENQCGKIKVKTCTNGSNKYRHLKYGEIISPPTVLTESLMNISIIDTV